MSATSVRLVQPVHRVLRNEFVRHSALVFSASILVNALNYIFNFAISRRIGVENFAELSALVSGLMILSVPASVLNLVVVKYVSEFHAVGDQARSWRLAQQLIRWTLGGALVVFLAGLALQPSAAIFLHIPNDAAITLSLALLAVSFITPSIRGVLQGEQDFTPFSVSLAIEAVLKVALGVSFVYAGLGVIGAMSGWLFGSAIALVFTIWIVYKHRAPDIEPARLSLNLRRLAKTAAGIASSTAGLTVLSFMDVLLVKHYFDAHQAGLYAAVNLTGKVVLFLVSFFPLILVPKAVARAKRGEPATGLLIQAGVGTALLSGATLAVFGLAPWFVIRLIAGSAFTGAAPYVFQYDLAMALLAIITLLVNYGIGLHRFQFLYGLFAVLVAETVAIVLNHHSLWNVIHILLGGNAVAIILCTYGIAYRQRTPLPAMQQSGAA